MGQARTRRTLATSTDAFADASADAFADASTDVFADASTDVFADAASATPTPTHSAAPQITETAVHFRPAVSADIPTLLRIESACFCGDRLSARSFRHLLTRGHAVCMVMTHENRILGYALVLFSVARSWGRLYSFAVDTPFQSKGLGRLLLSAAEQAARLRRRDRLRLEVRRDNLSAIALYRKQGYRQFGVYADYYEDHMEALRLEKILGPIEASEFSLTPGSL